MRTLRVILWIGLLIAMAFVGAAANSLPAGNKHAPPFIVFCNVFDEKGFAVEGAEARLRRASEKKDRWQARSDRRGELAMRVPPGEEYELTVAAKGYQTQSQKVDGRQANRMDLTFHLMVASNQKKAEKPAKERPAQEKPPQEVEE